MRITRKHRLLALASAVLAVPLLMTPGTALAGSHPAPPGLAHAEIPGIAPLLGLDSHGKPHNKPPAPVTPCPAGCGYEYSVAGAGIGSTAPTSGSIKMSVTQQGTKQTDGTYANDCNAGWCLGQNHSLQNFYVVGTCTTIVTGKCDNNTNHRPALEIQLIQGNQYCKASGDPCFRAWSWLNGNWTHTDGYVDLSGGLMPNDGTWDPPLNDPAAFTLGYSLSFGRINVVLKGTIVGYFPDSYWGQTNTWGPITAEDPQTEAFMVGGTYGTAPYTSMDNTLSNFTDSAGDTLGTVTVNTGYTSSGASGTGWTVSGGSAPTDSGTDWQIPLAQDNGMCLDDKNGDHSNFALVQLWHCNGGVNQRWHTNGTEIILGTTGKCLYTPSATNGTQLEINACNGSAGETWNWGSGSGNYIAINTSLGTGPCIDDTAGSTHDGDKAQVYACNGGANQDSDPWFQL